MGAGSRYGIFPADGTQQLKHVGPVRPGGWQGAADPWFGLPSGIHQPFFLCAQSPDLQNKAEVFCKPSVWGRGGVGVGGGRPKAHSLELTVSPQDGGERGAGLACVWDWDGEAGPHRPVAPSGPRELTLASGTLCRASPLSLSPSSALKSALKSLATL